MLPLRDFPWSVTALGALVFTALRYTAAAAARWLGAPADGTPLSPRTIPLTLLVGLILSAALTWVVLADGDGTTTARATPCRAVLRGARRGGGRCGGDGEHRSHPRRAGDRRRRPGQPGDRQSRRRARAHARLTTRPTDPGAARANEIPTRRIPNRLKRKAPQRSPVWGL